VCGSDPTVSTRGVSATGRTRAGSTRSTDLGVLGMERLKGESTVGLLAPTTTLGDVWVVLTHCLRFVDLQLSVQPLQFILTRKQTTNKQYNNDIYLYVAYNVGVKQHISNIYL